MWRRLFQRLMNIFKAEANNALDVIEDPVKMIKLAIQEMEVSVQKSTEALANAISNKKSLEKKYEQHHLESLSWYDKAAVALKSGDEEIAKKALQKKALADQQAEQYQALVQNSQSTVDTLKEQLERMKMKLEEAKTKESILIAKAQNAKAQAEIASQLAGIKNSALSNFNKYEEKIKELENKAEALTEIAHVDRTLEEDIQKLETNYQISNDLASLKERVQKEEEQKRMAHESKSEKKFEKAFNVNSSQPLPPKNEKYILPEKASNEHVEKKINDFFKDK